MNWLRTLSSLSNVYTDTPHPPTLTPSFILKKIKKTKQLKNFPQTQDLFLFKSSADPGQPSLTRPDPHINPRSRSNWAAGGVRVEQEGRDRQKRLCWECRHRQQDALRRKLLPFKETFNETEEEEEFHHYITGRTEPGYSWGQTVTYKYFVKSFEYF